MKKILSIILALSTVAALSACKGEDADKAAQKETVKETVTQKDNNEDKNADEKEDITESETKEPESDTKSDKDTKADTNKTPAVKTDSKNETKADSKADAKPSAAPTAKPTAKPTEAPTENPAPTPTPQPESKTLGNTLLADFKTKANTGMSAEDIANGLIENPKILFAGATREVEPGYLTGFGNAEIKGFKKAVAFQPIIGSIPFVGYVFELNDASAASSFISNLKKNANKRWNVCTEADEMVTGSVGNKVFFVMCPTSLED